MLDQRRVPGIGAGRPEVAVTEDSEVSVPGLGVETTVQEVPSQCSVSVVEASSVSQRGRNDRADAGKECQRPPSPWPALLTRH